MTCKFIVNTGKIISTLLIIEMSIIISAIVIYFYTIGKTTDLYSYLILCLPFFYLLYKNLFSPNLLTYSFELILYLLIDLSNAYISYIVSIAEHTAVCSTKKIIMSDGCIKSFVDLYSNNDSLSAFLDTPLPYVHLSIFLLYYFARYRCLIRMKNRLSIKIKTLSLIKKILILIIYFIFAFCSFAACLLLTYVVGNDWEAFALAGLILIIIDLLIFFISITKFKKYMSIPVRKNRT